MAGRLLHESDPDIDHIESYQCRQHSCRLVKIRRCQHIADVIAQLGGVVLLEPLRVPCFNSLDVLGWQDWRTDEADFALAPDEVLQARPGDDVDRTVEKPDGP